jgi:ribosome-binding factor A
MKWTPVLNFLLDESVEKGNRVIAILESIEKGNSPSA